MTKINVAVLFGGKSFEHEISLMSADTIMNNMSLEKYNVIPIFLTNEGKWVLFDGKINNLKDTMLLKFGSKAAFDIDNGSRQILRIVDDKVKEIPIDVVFPVLHGQSGEDGRIQGLLELNGVPYVGCNLESSILSFDKHLTKIVAGTLDIRQAPSLTLTSNDLVELDETLKKIRYKIGYPCFVKPAKCGSSIGISRAENKKQLQTAILLAFEYDSKVIVEKEIVGRELECAVLGDGGEDTRATIAGEILSGDEFYDYDAKYVNPESQTVIPADISDEVHDEIAQTSIKIFKSLGCYGLSRVDFFLENETNKVYFNEINTMPGFTSISMYHSLWSHMGLTVPELIDTLIELALKREEVK